MTACSQCQGEMRAGTATLTPERDRTTLVLKEVPATVCDQCGYTLYVEEVTRRALGMLDDAVRRGVQVEVTIFPDASRLHAAA